MLINHFLSVSWGPVIPPGEASVAVEGANIYVADLVGVSMTPDVFACGVDLVGPSSIATLLAFTPGIAFTRGITHDMGPQNTGSSNYFAVAGTGEGASRRAAEQLAAEAVLAALTQKKAARP